MNVIDFIKINGHKSFSVLSFSEIDALALAQLSYMNYNELITSFDDVIDGSNLDAYETSILLSSRNMGDTKNDEKLVKEILSSKRYQDLKFAHYINDHSEKQFCAITFIFKDFICVSYMGTDDTIVGWKEDFALSYLPEIASHKEGLSYLEKIACKYDLPIVLTGHSKGGNVAIYSYLNSSENIKKRITKVYTYDAPGFNKETIDKIIDDTLIDSYIPESSFIGLIMHQVKDCKIVASNKPFMFQHNIYNWLLDENGFLYEEKLAKKSVAFAESNKAWIDSFTNEERQVFFETVFDLFENNDIDSFLELKKNSKEKITKIIDSSAKISKEHKELMKSIIKSLISLYLKILFDRKN